MSASMKNDLGTGRAPRAADLLSNIGPSHQAIAARAARAGRAARRLGMRARRLAARSNVAHDWILPDGQRISAAIDARRAAMKRQVAGLFA